MTNFLGEQIDFLSRWAEVGSASFPLNWRTKFELMQHIRARSMMPAGLRVTNLGSTRPFSTNEIGFEFSYKRQGTDFKVPLHFLDDFTAPPRMPDTLLTPVFTANGQAAMSLALSALSRIDRSLGIHESSVYFETKNFCDMMALSARTRQDKHRIHIWDATTPWDLGADEKPAALVVDTTYLLRDEIPEPEIRILQRDIPVFFVRSHLKLDSLGAEYGPWGSLWISCPESHGLKDALHRTIFDLARLWGCWADVESIYPFLTDREYKRLNRDRNLRIKLKGKNLRENIQDPRVTHFDHGLFVFLDNSTGKLAVPVLHKIFKAHGIENHEVDSFGFDFVAIKAFDRQRPTIRVTMHDGDGDLVAAVRACLNIL